MIAIASVFVLGVIGAIAGGGGDDGELVTTATDPSLPATSEPDTTPTEATSASETSVEAETTEVPETTEPEATTTEASTTTQPPTTTTTTTTIPPTTLPPIPGFGSGVQLVGQDLQPGVYTTPGADSFGCYFERLSGLSGEFDDIITNGNSEGPVLIEILPTDIAFSSNGCQRWTAYLGGTPVESFGDGDWFVGQQVTPGRWSTEGDASSFGCYWERASGFTHEFEEIVANDNVEGRAIVDISPSDARFTSSGCGTWTRIG